MSGMTDDRRKEADNRTGHQDTHATIESYRDTIRKLLEEIDREVCS